MQATHKSPYHKWLEQFTWKNCPNIEYSVQWNLRCKTVFKIEQKFFTSMRNWSSFISDIPDEIKDELAQDLLQWTTDYADTAGNTPEVYSLVCTKYYEYIPKKNIGDSELARNMANFICQQKLHYARQNISEQRCYENIKNELMAEFNIDAQEANNTIEWSKEIEIITNKAKELIGFGIHKYIIDDFTNQTITKPNKTREGGTVKTRTKNANSAIKALSY